MTKLLAPATLILRNLSIPKKLLLLGVLLIAPLVVQTGFFIQRTNLDIERVRVEQQGVEYHASLIELQRRIAHYRERAYFLQFYAEQNSAELQSLRLAVGGAIEAVDRFDWQFGHSLEVSEHWTRIKSRWQVLSSDTSSPIDKQLEQYNQLLAELMATMVVVADNSGLVLDPDIQSYYLMMMLVYEVPELINTTQKLAMLEMGGQDRADNFKQQGLYAPTLIAVLRSGQTRLIKVQAKVLQENPDLREKMAGQLEQTLSHLNRFLVGMLAERDQAQPASLGANAVDSLFKLYDLSSKNLFQLLDQQASAFTFVRNIALMSISLCLLLGFYLFTGFYFALRHDLKAVVKAAKRLEAGDTGYRVNTTGDDELGVVAHGFNDMAETLEQSQKEVKEAYRRQEQLTKSDPLTGLANRRFLDEVLASEWQRATRNRSYLTIIMLDIDYFKQFNDLYGHAVGDDCLCRIARELSLIMKRGGDFVARYGGEEFIVISPETNAKQAEELAKTIQKGIESLHIPHGGSLSSDYVTASLGVASIKPQESAGTSKCLIKQADSALYQAKDAGRNCFVIDATKAEPAVVRTLYPNQDPH